MLMAGKGRYAQGLATGCQSLLSLTDRFRSSPGDCKSVPLESWAANSAGSRSSPQQGRVHMTTVPKGPAAEVPGS